MTIAKSMDGKAALGWFQQLDYAVFTCPQMAPGEMSVELGFFDDLVLVGRLCLANLQSSRGITQ